MKHIRKIIWGGVVLLACVAFGIVLYLTREGAQFSVGREGIPMNPTVRNLRGSDRMAFLNGPFVPVNGGGTAENGIRLRAVLPLAGESTDHIIAIRSVGGVYPDGTSARYEVLYTASSSLYRKLITKKGIESTVRIAGVPPHTSTFPANFPDSNDALLQLTANPYFAHARVSGIALYYDEVARRWSYVVRTDSGDVNIILSTAVNATRAK